MNVQLARRLFTVREYYQMSEAGILTEDDRVELLDGEVVQMTPIGSRHADCVDRLTQLLVERVARRAIVRVQNPIRLGERSELQPDLTLVKPHRSYAASHPDAEDILLLLEVADTSAETDREIKIPLYASAGIPEAWLIDLPRASVEVYRQPDNGHYQEIRTMRRGEILAPMAFPDLELLVDTILDPIPG